MALSKDGFLKFVVESIAEEALLFETYASAQNATVQQKRDLIDQLRQAGIELQHGPDPEVPKVADVIAARVAKEEAAKAERQLEADKQLKKDLTKATE